MVAIAVIRIGRSRRRPPSTTASRTPMPCARYWLIRSISTIALVTTMPTSISMPISAGTPSGGAGDQQQADRAGRRERDGDQQDQRLDQAAERRRP